jgi:hypothetical protein
LNLANVWSARATLVKISRRRFYRVWYKIRFSLLYVLLLAVALFVFLRACQPAAAATPERPSWQPGRIAPGDRRQSRVLLLAPPASVACQPRQTGAEEEHGGRFGGGGGRIQSDAKHETVTVWRCPNIAEQLQVSPGDIGVQQFITPDSFQKRLESATKSTERSNFQKSTVFATVNGPLIAGRERFK